MIDYYKKCCMEYMPYSTHGDYVYLYDIDEKPKNHHQLFILNIGAWNNYNISNETPEGEDSKIPRKFCLKVLIPWI